jgi:hypothetical protein
MPTRAEERDLKHGGSGGQFEPYQTWGRDVGNPANTRLQGQAAGFGQDYQGALAQQGAMYDQFGQMAAGQGPSLAQSQLQQGMNQAQQAAVQSALAARGGNAAGGQAAAMQAATAFGGQAAVQSAQLAQQEQIAAMQAQAGMANQMAGQGLQGQLGLEGMYQQNLGMQYQGDIDYRLGSRNARANERMGHNQRIRGNVGGATLGIAGDSSGGVMSDVVAKKNIEPASGVLLRQPEPYQGAGAVDPYSMDEINAMRGPQSAGRSQIDPNNKWLQAGQQQGGGLGKVLGLVGLLSDERTKRNISPGNLSASQAVGSLDPYTFEYESGLGQPAGRHIGVMAQDLEQVAPQAVSTGPDGLKRIDTAQATGLTLAASAEQAQRQQEQEERLRMLEGMLAGGPMRSYDATQGTFQGTDGARVASNLTRDSYSLGGVRGSYG